MNRTTLDAIGKIAFDSDIASLQGKEDNPFITAITKALAGFSYKINNPVKLQLMPWMDREFKVIFQMLDHVWDYYSVKCHIMHMTYHKHLGQWQSYTCMSFFKFVLVVFCLHISINLLALWVFGLVIGGVLFCY